MTVPVAAPSVAVTVGSTVLECINADEVHEESKNRHNEKSFVLDLQR